MVEINNTGNSGKAGACSQPYRNYDKFFDFYIYATAAVLVFPKLFFPGGADPTSATLESLATFALAFFASAIGCRIIRAFWRP